MLLLKLKWTKWMTLISDWPVAGQLVTHGFPRSLLHRDSTEELMDLSEEERNELMKKESSRLLKTGHRVSYSPRKEKALKIYLDGGPTKDPGQDWEGRGVGGTILPYSLSDLPAAV